MPRKNTTRKRHWFAFSPATDTWLACLSVPIMALIYFGNAHYGYDHPAVFFIGFVLCGNLILNTALPAYVVLRQRGEGLSGLGITRKFLWLSFGISCALGAALYFPLRQALAEYTGDPAPLLTFNAIALWEPLFIFGWLQLRFERAFGILPSIMLGAAGFTAYHIGSVDMSVLSILFISGLFYGSIFAMVRNLLVMFPITCAFGASIGTIQSGYVFDWMTVFIYIGVLIVQILILTGFNIRGAKS